MRMSLMLRHSVDLTMTSSWKETGRKPDAPNYLQECAVLKNEHRLLAAIRPVG